MLKIHTIKPNVIKDTRGEPTIEVTLGYDDITTKASVPCGKSKGEYEAYCHPAGISAKLIEEITPKIISQNFENQESFDRLILSLDGTENKEKLGTNVTLSLSIAFSRLAAKVKKQNLYNFLGEMTGVETPKFPLLFFNLINGGLHADNSHDPLPFQEYLVIPKDTSPKQATKVVGEFIESLKICLDERSCPLIFGDEGGFIVSGDNPINGFEIFADNLEKRGKDFSEKFSFGLDASASSLVKDSDNYKWRNKEWTTQELKQLYKKLISTYPILSLEDPFSQNSWFAWAEFKKEVGDKIWIVGDDLVATNTGRMKKARELDSINAVVIKPNQTGTVTETIEAIKLARDFGWKFIVSHRSGETTDDFIADLAYGTAADGLKSGSPLQHERLVKYNRLIAIEDSLEMTANS